MSNIFDGIKEQFEMLTDLQQKSYKAGYEKGFEEGKQAKEKELLEQAEQDETKETFHFDKETGAKLKHCPTCGKI